MSDNEPVKKLDNILKKTVEAIESSKTEIYDIAEHSRREFINIENDLKMIKEQITTCISRVDKLQKQWNLAKQKLAFLSANFNSTTEEELKQAYKEADELRIELMLEKEREQYLVQKRNDLEIRFRAIRSTVEKADNLINHVGVALNFLTGDLKQLSDTVEDLKGKHSLGIKVLKAQEEERKRVAREIHDGPAQSMANLILKTELCEKLMTIDAVRAREELKTLKNHLRLSIQDVRRIIYDLRPMSLDDLGLISTLEEYITEFGHQNGTETKFIVNGSPKNLENIVSLSLFRVVQEALNNIRKHAEAISVKVMMSYYPNNLEVVIIDDGKGFDMEEVLKRNRDLNSGFGLQSMKERVMLLSGTFEVRTKINEGTKYLIKIPLHQDIGGQV